ncbi:MAG: type IV secretory system conjugative DNA transfer family protein [Clostridia bacterium]|nr:type IV secretory system conjugative DNA transfer family protein [Clostridia bacterium]
MIASTHAYKYKKFFTDQIQSITIADITNDNVRGIRKRLLEDTGNCPVGVTLGSYRTKNGVCFCQTEKLYHTLVSAGTGAGKTQTFCLNNIANASGANSFIINDPKGEITSNTYNYLCNIYGKDKVTILNFSNPTSSQARFNPFYEMAVRYKASQNLPSEKKKIEREEICALAQDYISNVFPIRDKDHDPSWDEGARQFLSSILIGMLEDTIKENIPVDGNGIPKTARKELAPEDVNFKTMTSILSLIDFDADSDGWGDGCFFSSRENDSIAKKHARTVLGAASSGTRSSYLSLVNSYMKPYFDFKTLSITEGDSFDFLSMATNPRVLYIVYDNTSQTQKKLVHDCLTSAISDFTHLYQKTGEPLKTPVVIMCEELTSLGNCSIIPETIAIARGMNVFLYLIIQSLSQLKDLYKEQANTIIENCGARIYLNTNDMDTAKAGSNDMGCVEQLDINALMAGKIHLKEEAILKPETLLYDTKLGECYIKVNNLMPIHSSYLLFFETKEFNRFGKVDINNLQTEESEEEDMEELFALLADLADGNFTIFKKAED